MAGLALLLSAPALAAKPGGGPKHRPQAPRTAVTQAAIAKPKPASLPARPAMPAVAAAPAEPAPLMRLQPVVARQTAPPPPPFIPFADPAAPLLQPIAFADIPGWAEDEPMAVLEPLQKSCRHWRAAAPERNLGGAGLAALRGGSGLQWQPACTALEAFLRTLPAPPRRARPAALRELEQRRNQLLRSFLEQHFDAFTAGQGLLTGYYEPELRGALARQGNFQTPLHATPPAPPPGQRHPDRGAIEQGALEGLGLEIVYVDDAVDAFFLHIQGSGRVVLPDGQVLRLGFAAQNGHPYVAVGRTLIERGAVRREEMSMQAIRRWLAEAPADQAATLLRSNPSYIFFRRIDDLKPEEGPIGAMGVPLTPGRSLAVDFAHVPMGAPVFVSSRDPLDGRPLRRLMLAQDTGGAIRGAGRGDLFWGWGAEAGERAGRMREPAEMFLLLPRVPPPTEVAGATP